MPSVQLPNTFLAIDVQFLPIDTNIINIVVLLGTCLPLADKLPAVVAVADDVAEELLA
jgi:hypothetical protein